MKRIIVLSEKHSVDQNWLDKLQILFPECQIKIQSSSSENKNPRRNRKTGRHKKACTHKIRETVQ